MYNVDILQVLILFLFFVLIACIFGFFASVYFVLFAKASLKFGGEMCNYDPEKRGSQIVLSNIFVDGNNFIYNFCGLQNQQINFNKYLVKSIMLLCEKFNHVNFVIKNMDINIENDNENGREKIKKLLECQNKLMANTVQIIKKMLDKNYPDQNNTKKVTLHIAHSDESFLKSSENKEMHYKKGRDDLLSIYLIDKFIKNNANSTVKLLSMDKYADSENFKNINPFKHFKYEIVSSKTNSEESILTVTDIVPSQIANHINFNEVINKRLYRYSIAHNNADSGQIFTCVGDIYKNNPTLALFKPPSY